MNLVVSDVTSAEQLLVKKACVVFIGACGRAEIRIHQKPAVHHKSVGVTVGNDLLTARFLNIQISPERESVGNSRKDIVTRLSALGKGNADAQICLDFCGAAVFLTFEHSVIVGNKLVNNLYVFNSDRNDSLS